MAVAVDYGIPTDKEAIQLRLGIARGIFRREGLDVALRVVFGGPEIAARYDSGALKLGELGSPPATTALARGARFRIVASGVRRRALQSFVAHPSVRDWNDLRGRTVAALSIGSCSYWFLRQVLLHHGIDPDREVRIVGLGARYPRVIELFANGELHGAVLSEPNIAMGEDAGQFRVMQTLTDPEFCPGMQWTVTVANNDVIEDEPELVKAVLRGCVESYRHAAANPDELAEFGAAYFGIHPDTMARSIRRESSDLHSEGEVDLPGLQQAIDLQRRLGAFDTPLAATDLVDPRFLPH